MTSKETNNVSCPKCLSLDVKKLNPDKTYSQYLCNVCGKKGVIRQPIPFSPHSENKDKRLSIYSEPLSELAQYILDYVNRDS